MFSISTDRKYFSRFIYCRHNQSKSPEKRPITNNLNLNILKKKKIRFNKKSSLKVIEKEVRKK